MTKTYAVVENGLVSNVVVAESPLFDNWVEAEEVSIGWSYVNGSFVSPTVPVYTPTKVQQEINRQAAYTAEADPLFFKWQAGEGTEEEWLAKRQEIRDRYPY